MTFDPIDHEYVVDGAPVPSVTQILAGVGLIDTTWFTSESAERGTAIHAITELVDKDMVTIDTLCDEYKPYIKAYADFLKMSGIEILQSEQKLYSETLGFAGTLDRLAALAGHDAVLDIKTGAKQKWHPVQLAGYKILSDNKKLKMYCLHLMSTGKFKLEIYKDDTQYRNLFLSALNIYKFRFL